MRRLQPDRRPLYARAKEAIRDLLTEQRAQQLVEEVEEEINEAVRIAEATPPMAPDSFFDYVAAELSPRQQAQRADLLRYIDKKP